MKSKRIEGKRTIYNGDNNNNSSNSNSRVEVEATAAAVRTSIYTINNNINTHG